MAVLPVAPRGTKDAGGEEPNVQRLSAHWYAIDHYWCCKMMIIYIINIGVNNHWLRNYDYW